MDQKRKSCQTTTLLLEQRSSKIRKINYEEDEDGFEKLPNDLMVDILISRVNNNDAKFLIQTLCLVNKRFASLIQTHITSVSTEVNNPVIKAAPYPKFNESIDYSLTVHYSSLFTTTTNPPPPLYTAKFRPLRYCPKIPPCNYFTRKAREKLHRFTGLEKAVIEYPYFDDFLSGGVLDRPMKWKLEYSSSGGGGIKSCALLGADPLNGEELDLKSRLSWLAICFKFAHRFRPMVVRMARDHRNLHDIAITSKSRPRYWIHAGEQELIKMRQQQDDDDDDSTRSMHMKVKLWHVPVIEFSPGIFIKGATFMIATITNSDDDEDEMVKEATRRFWGGYHGAPGETMTQVMHGVEARMSTVVDNTNCTLEINTISNWTGKNTKSTLV